MKRIILFLTLTTISIMTSAQTQEAQTITDLTEKLRKAMISGDKVELEGLAWDELSYGHSGGRVEDKAAFVTALSTKTSDFKTIGLTDLSVTVAGKTGIVRHFLKADTNDGGIPGKVSLGVVLIWEKRAEEWRLLARRSFKVSN